MRLWWWALAGFAAVRVAIPLAVLAAEGRALPGLPRYDYRPLNGDANDFYATSREFISTLLREAPIVAALALLVGAAVVAGRRLRRTRPRLGWTAVALPAVAVGLALAVVITFMTASGAGAFGWPLVWSLPMMPLRVAGALDPDSAFVVGFALSLIANAVTVVAIAFVGRFATGRAEVGLAAAGLFALWPLLVGLVAGERGWENGSWQIDAGLHLYTEPLSTALVTVAAALLLDPGRTQSTLAAAGVLLGLATTVRLSNSLLAAVAVAALWAWARTGLVPFVAGAAASVPVVVAYWPIGYVPRFDDPQAFPQRPFSLHYLGSSWTDSLLFDPATLAVLAPLALVGAFALRTRPFALLLLGGWIVATAAFYSVYESTAQHPRFLYVVLPSLFVPEAAGAFAVAGILTRRRLIRTS